MNQQEQREPKRLHPMDVRFMIEKQNAYEELVKKQKGERTLSRFHVGMAIFYLLLPVIGPVSARLLFGDGWLAADWVLQTEIFLLGVFGCTAELYLLRYDRRQKRELERLNRCSERIDQACIDCFAGALDEKTRIWPIPEPETEDSKDEYCPSCEAFGRQKTVLQYYRMIKKIQRARNMRMKACRRIVGYGPRFSAVLSILAAGCLVPLLASYVSSDGVWTAHAWFANLGMLLTLCVLAALEVTMLWECGTDWKEILAAGEFLGTVYRPQDKK